MIGYATVGVNDLDTAIQFYDRLFALFGVKRIHAFDRGHFYGVDHFEFAVVKPFDGNPASHGNGAMTALEALSRAVVDQAYALALSLGGTDEGAPGIRGREDSGFYGAYFRDPDGNKLCVFKMGPA
jgi:catechol 2,3-dioxygenase-like lactoylglutathione lyase family enzyme